MISHIFSGSQVVNLNGGKLQDSGSGVLGFAFCAKCLEACSW